MISVTLSMRAYESYVQLRTVRSKVKKKTQSGYGNKQTTSYFFLLQKFKIMILT